MSDNSPQRRARSTAALLAVVLGMALLVSGCSTEPESGIEITGSFIEQAATISMPSLPVTELDASVGTVISGEGTSTAPVTVVAANSATSNVFETLQGPVKRWHRVMEMRVKPGDEVFTGQVLAVIDHAEADAAVQAAEADLTAAQATVGMLDSRTGEIADNRAETASQTAELETAISDLQTNRAELQLQLDQARTAASPPSAPSTATPSPEVIAKIAQLEAAIEEVDAGIERAQKGIEQLKNAQTRLEQAEGVLSTVRRTAEALIDARVAARDLMIARRDQATILSPADGIVLSAVSAGETFAEGAPLLELRTLDRPLVHTYLTAEQAKRIRDGSSARVSLDSMPGVEYTGLIIGMGSEYEYVPSTFATKIIHLTRGFEVTIEVYGAPELPPGTPADLFILTE